MRTCSIFNCDNEHVAKGFCNLHYKRARGDTALSLQAPPRSSHKLSNSSEYSSWTNMKNRCYYVKGDKYKNYGGRGIKVCERWLNSFDNFYADMGVKPTPTHTIERKNVHGNYEPGNCVWGTPNQQGVNKQKSSTHVGVTKVSMTSWEACLQVGRVRVFRKRFRTKREAIAARKKAEIAYL